ncbi:MAG: ribosomal protein S18-alanine N-acetyltransferase [Candidatus Verstraetearchaeota archaeon]|jgi:ribosomal-protein-alanine N-acetyltransferase|nr:ribosomal protein S18-alanine N-acetyltransferase [Candidatus Verstraetearchaeota archaeon]
MWEPKKGNEKSTAEKPRTENLSTSAVEAVNNFVGVREATLNDLNEIYAIEKESFPDPYPKPLLKAFFFHPGAYIVAVVEKKVVGYAIGIIRYRSLGHVISIAVRKDFRGKGIGKKLLNELIDRLFAMGAKKIRIEVRESNEIAINLYKKVGFVTKEKIIGYYPDGETALVMFIDLPQGRRM